MFNGFTGSWTFGCGPGVTLQLLASGSGTVAVLHTLGFGGLTVNRQAGLDRQTMAAIVARGAAANRFGKNLYRRVFQN
jgi:hypothetical protein